MSKLLFFAMSGTGKRQANRDTPLATADINTRVALTNKAWVDTQKTIEEILNCVGTEVVSREVTRMIRRMTVEATFAPTVGAKFFAYAKGVAAAPSGTSTNKIMQIVVDATSGTYILTIPIYDGQVAQPTAPIAFNATISQLKYAIESLDNVGYGNTIVTLPSAGTYLVEFTGKRAKANIPNFTANAAGLAGGASSVTISQTQAGAQRTHPITENPDYDNPYTSFMVGFEDDPDSVRRLEGAQIEAVRVNAPEGGGAMTMGIDILCRDLVPISGYTPPVCAVPRPTRLADCRLTHGGIERTDALIDFAYAFINNIPTGNSAYPGRGVKPGRLERGKRRNRTLGFRLLGAISSDLRLEAETNPEADIKRATVLRMGTEGDAIEETFPNNTLTLDGAGLDFQAETDDSINRYTSNADEVGTTDPSSTIARISQATALLLT